MSEHTCEFDLHECSSSDYEILRTLCTRIDEEQVRTEFLWKNY